MKRSEKKYEGLKYTNSDQEETERTGIAFVKNGDHYTLTGNLFLTEI